MTDKSLAELLTKYKNGPSDGMELEIRFKGIDRQIFQQLYAKFSEHTAPAFEFTINTIANDANEKSRGSTSSLIRRLTFEKGIKIADEYMQKTPLVRPVKFSEFLKYTVSLAQEAKTKPFTPSSVSTVRIKSRAMFTIGKWRYDMTAVKTDTLGGIGLKLKDIVGKYFTISTTPSEYIKNLDFDYFDTLEVEAELRPGEPAAQEDISACVSMLFEKIDPKFAVAVQYQNEIYHIATRLYDNKYMQEQFKSRHGFKKLGNAAIALDKNTYYEFYPPVGYYLTEKADGVRTMISIHGAICAIITSADCKIIAITNANPENAREVVLDCEMVGEPPVYYVFDCMVWGNPTGTFAERIEVFEPAIEYARKVSGLDIVAKKFVKIGADLKAAFTSVYEAKHKYQIDGLILTEPDKRYIETKNYKWKSYDHNTIDFLAIKCPSKIMGVKPFVEIGNHDLYILFVGIDYQYREKLGLGFVQGYKQMTAGMLEGGNYIPIQFSPSANPLAFIYYHASNDNTTNATSLDGKIVELRRNADNTRWEFLRIREDRKMERGYYGNDYRIAELTYMNYIDKFELSALWQENIGYFKKTASTIHTAPNRFKRFVISDLLKQQLGGANWIIDEASGRGADIHRYQEIGVQNALFIEIDPTAIAELIRRKFEYANRGARPQRKITGAYDSIRGVDISKIIDKGNKNFTCNVMVGDLKTDASVLLSRIADFGIVNGTINGIVCNFAFHYMCDTVEHIRNLLQLNATLLAQGGLFILTVMNGAKVHELLAAGDYKCYQDDVLKYSIKKLYKSDKLTSAGQMISVLMPFSDNHYDEPLCNIDFVISEAAKLGFEHEFNESFASYFDKFSGADKLLSESLTEDDRKYIDLYHFITLRLVKKSKK